MYQPLYSFDPNNLHDPLQPKPTIRQLKAICAWYKIIRPVRNKSTRVELLHLLNEHNVKLFYYKHKVGQKELEGAIVHFMQSSNSHVAESSDDYSRSESDCCDSDETYDEPDQLDVDGKSEIYGDYCPSSGDVVFEEEVKTIVIEPMEVSDDFV